MKKGIVIITLLVSVAGCNNREVKSSDTKDPGTDVTFGADTSKSGPDTGSTAPRKDSMPDTLRVRFPDK